MKTDFFKKVITSQDWYWVVSKKNEAREAARWIRKEDIIVLIAIPVKWKRGLKPEEILLMDVENYSREYVENNIYLNKDYPPFQECQSLSNAIDGFPISKEIICNDFIAKAIQMESDNLYDYKKLMDEMVEAKTEQS